MPQKKVLELIFWDDLGHCQYTTFPGNVNDNVLGIYLETQEVFLKQFYKTKFERELEDSFLKKNFAVGLEALKNAKYHGSGCLTLFSHGIFLGQEGICNGFQDRGKFLRQDDVKKTLESKGEITEFDKNYEGCHAGLKAYIYPNSDFICVDNLTGVLYCVNRFDE